MMYKNVHPWLYLNLVVALASHAMPIMQVKQGTLLQAVEYCATAKRAVHPIAVKYTLDAAMKLACEL